MSPFIILIEGRVEVEGAGAVNIGGVFGVEGVVDVVEVGAGSGADAKVVGHESESGERFHG